MEMVGKIRRIYLRDQLSLHEIAKRSHSGAVTLIQRFGSAANLNIEFQHLQRLL